jgi:hypothetical protein
MIPHKNTAISQVMHFDIIPPKHNELEARLCAESQI